MLSKRLCAGLAVAAFAAIGVAAAPTPAEAWWRGGWCCGFGVGFVLPPIVVAPPVYAPPPPPAYYPPPPAYYAPPAAYSPQQSQQQVWIPPHWQGTIWIPGHWA